MSSIDFLDYFLVKERLVDMSYRENLRAAEKGDAIDRVISDLYLARKLIYQQCKAAGSVDELEDILSGLENDIPMLGTVFNPEEFTKAWNLTISELRGKFNAYRHIKH